MATASRCSKGGYAQFAADGGSQGGVEGEIEGGGMKPFCTPWTTALDDTVSACSVIEVPLYKLLVARFPDGS